MAFDQRGQHVGRQTNIGQLGPNERAQQLAKIHQMLREVWEQQGKYSGPHHAAVSALCTAVTRLTEMIEAMTWTEG